MIDATNQMKTAAWTFSGAAQGINNAGWNAVGRLNDQATRLGKNVTQTQRLANETSNANANVTASDRPWIGATIQVANFDAGKRPTVTINYINSGKLPAVVDFTGVHSDFFLAFPPNPREQYLTGRALKESASKSILVPGEVTQMNYTAQEPITQAQWDLVPEESSGIRYFVFSTAEYRDLVTNELHYTRACVRFYADAQSAADAGFRNCQEYNDAN